MNIGDVSWPHFCRSATRSPATARPDRLAPARNADGHSGDRLHIEGLARGYNGINRNLGYQELILATPTRYRAAQAGTP
jgi:hypothetical protein